jgi:hypothetical protein
MARFALQQKWTGWKLKWQKRPPETGGLDL